MQSQGFLTLTIYSLCTFSPELVCNFHDGWKYVTSVCTVLTEAATVCGQDKKYDAGVATLHSTRYTRPAKLRSVASVPTLLLSAASSEHRERRDS